MLSYCQDTFFVNIKEEQIVQLHVILTAGSFLNMVNLAFKCKYFAHHILHNDNEPISLLLTKV